MDEVGAYRGSPNRTAGEAVERLLAFRNDHSPWPGLSLADLVREGRKR